jgi:Ca2+-binding EF-hand superfamily protein
MNTTIQRTLLSAVMATAFSTAMAAAPEKDPGQQEPASAQPNPSAQQPNNPSMQQSMPSAMTAPVSAATQQKFDAFDVNHDGVIDQQEANASKELSAQFSKLDANNDGKLTVIEFNKAQNMAMIKIDPKKKGF